MPVAPPPRGPASCHAAAAAAAARLLCWAACAGLAGCAAPQLLPYRPDEPLTAQLPLMAAGVRDERAGFARVFARELRAAAGAGTTPAAAAASEPATWLHGIAPSPETADPAALPEFLARIEARFLQRRAGTLVLVIPGLFGDCVDDQSVPFGDGVVRPPELQAVQAYGRFADLGLHGMRLVRLAGRQSAEHNGERLAAVIRSEAARPGVDRIVLVGYSKGVPDALHALQALRRAGEGTGRVVALVSVAGAVMGTPLADRFRPLYDAISPHVDPFGCTPSDRQELASLTRHERARWLAANPPVPGVASYSIVAYTAPQEMAPLLRPAHALLAGADPRNDGQMLASDAVLPGSTVLAAARSDHWDLALPRDRHPNAAVRSLGSGRGYPREVLLRATLKWVLADVP